MPNPVIVKKTKLKTAPGSMTRDGYELTWRWLVEVDQVIEQSQVLSLVAADTDIPKPFVHAIAIGGTIAVCDRLNVQPSRQSRKHWIVSVEFSPPPTEDNSPQPPPPPPPSAPGELPTQVSSDYADWTPSLARSPNRYTHPATKAFYLGGYNGIAHTDLLDWSVGNVPVELVNSAFQNLLEGPEAGVSTALWTARFYTTNPNEVVLDYEGTTNSADIDISHRGLTLTWPKWTVRLEGVSMQVVSRGGEERWEITLNILEDPRTFEREIADKGTVRRAFNGDPDDYGGSTVWTPGRPAQRPILDSDGRLVTSPVYLNGNGQPLEPRYQIVYGKWRVEPEKDWATMPYLSVFIPPPIP